MTRLPAVIIPTSAQFLEPKSDKKLFKHGFKNIT